MSAARLLAVLILIVVLFAAVGLYADFRDVADALSGFAWIAVLPGVLLAFLNYVLRFFKWDFFLKSLGKPVDARTSASVFFAGLSMSVTPGKVGELLKSYLLKQTSDVPVAVSAPVVVAERLTDLLALVVLAAFGVVSSGYGLDVVLAACVLCSLVLLLALWRRAGSLVLKAMGRLPFLRKRQLALEQLQDSLFRLVGLKNLLVGTALSAAAWFAECLAFYIILIAAGTDVPLGTAVFVYSLGTIAGAVTMLPGGLVATEASMVAMLVEVFRHATRPAGITAVFVVRLCTLWFAVLVGVVALALVKRRLRQPVDISRPGC